MQETCDRAGMTQLESTAKPEPTGTSGRRDNSNGQQRTAREARTQARREEVVGAECTTLHVVIMTPAREEAQRQVVSPLEDRGTGR